MSARSEDLPRRRTRIADRVNALVWRLPAPRRLRVLLSQLAYRNPSIPPERVIETLLALDLAGIAVVVIGGWGIDALVGRQLRPHADLDLFVDERDFERAAPVLRRLGYEPWNRSAPGPIGELQTFSVAQTFRDSAFRVTEVHAVALERVRSETGTIAGQPVTCLSVKDQMRAQRLVGRTWTPKQRFKQRRNLAALLSVLKTGM